MAIISDTTLVLQDLVEQNEGKTALTLADVTDTVSFGNKLLSSAEDSARDVVFKSLLDRIGRTVVDLLKYDNRFSKIFKEAFEYGAILQTIHVSNFEVMTSGIYDNLDDGDVDEALYRTYKATVDQTLYENIQPWEFAVTIFDDQIKTAFINEEGVAGFINGIFLAMENSIVKYLETCARTCYINLIIADYNKGGNVACNVLQAYYDETGIELTEDNFQYDEGLNRWLTSKFTDTRGLMEEMTVLFNHKGYETFTPRNANHFVINTKIADNIKRFMTSNVYNDELVSMPNYTEISSWQAIGTSASLSDRLGVNGKFKNPEYVEGGSKPEYISANIKVIAVMHDDRVLSMTLKDRRTATKVNEHGARRNVWEQGTVCNFVNLGHNSVIFYVAPVVKSVDIKLDKTSINIGVGDTETITATVNPDDATVTWGSSNTSVATVNNGVVTGAGVGTAVISAIATKDGASDIALSVAQISASTLGITTTRKKK